MLKIHKSHSKKLLIIPITTILGASSLLGLTYYPNLTHAETVAYPEKETRTMNDITYMQDITPEICQNSELNKQYTLIDKRDNNTYSVTRIKNQTDNKSNCWMTRNLKIINKNISYVDSDIEGSFLIPASDMSGFTSDNDRQPKAYYNESSQESYYNWYAATANSDTITIQNTKEAAYSICPKGWSLPSSADFINLASELSIQQLNTAPYYYYFTGRISGGSLEFYGTSGAYWSSSSNGDNSTSASTLFFLATSKIVSPSAQTPKYQGYSVRCVARAESIPNNNIDITINNTISLDVTNEVEVKKSNTNPSTAAFSALVASNQPYSVSISSSSPNLSSSTSSTTIPSKSGTLTSNDNAWGIKLSTASTYEQITTTPKLFYSSTTPESKTIPLHLGISTTEDLPAGEYSTNITVTATQN